MPVVAIKESFDREFGERAQLSAVLRVGADRYDLVETREIDGHPYVPLRADDGIEVSGVNVTAK